MKSTWIILGCLGLSVGVIPARSATTAFVDSANWMSSSEWITLPDAQNLEGFESVPVGTSFSSRNFNFPGSNPTNQMTIRMTQGGNLLVQTNALGGLLGQGGGGAFLTVSKPDANAVSFEISFSESVRAVSFYLGDFGDGLASTSLLIKDQNNITLWSSSTPGSSYAGQSISGLGGASWGFLGFTSPDGLNRLTFSVGGTSGDNFAIDTIRFNTIPEPAAVSLMVAGLSAATVLRRVQRKAD